MKLDSNKINQIADKFLAGQSVAQIADELDMSRQNVKRALAEAGLMQLSWYKTTNELQMLNYLKGMGINNLVELRSVL